MQVTYTNNNRIIFDVTGKDILKHIGKDISTLLALLVLTSIAKDIALEGTINAFKTVGNVECLSEAFKTINSTLRI